MYGYPSSALGGGDGAYSSQSGYSTRHRGRGQQGGQEEQYVEGSLFGSSKRASFHSTEPPAGKPPRTPYYSGDMGNGVGRAGSQEQQPSVRSSPFARHSLDGESFTTPLAMHGTGGAHGTENFASNSARINGTDGPWAGANNGEMALTQLDRGDGDEDGAAPMDEDEDDMLPTRSLVVDTSGVDGLRQRRTSTDYEEKSRNEYQQNAVPDAQRETWVVVWGVPPGMSGDVLSCFLNFGHIEETRGHPDSNWVYLKYATRLQAAKARVAGHGCRLTNNIMLGVQSVDDDEAWHSLRVGQVPRLEVGEAAQSRAQGANSTVHPTDSDRNTRIDDDLVRAAPPRPRGGEGNMCRRILRALGFYL